jgi:flagellar biosynthesis protein FlhF
MAEMRSVLDAVGRGGTTQLVVSATTKFADLLHILRQFEPFGYDSVIVTKLDETSSVGNVISALADARKPVSYLCSGQVVPQDIAPASTLRLLLNLDGFRLDRTMLEQEFGERNAANGAAAAVAR